jgi:phosphatidate cytidylyltransferase
VVRVAISAEHRESPSARRPGSALKKRVLTATVLLPLILGGMFLLPNILWGLLILAVAALGAMEWARLAGYSRKGGIALVAIVAGSGLLLLLGQWRLPTLVAEAAEGLFLVSLLFWSLVVPAWLYFRWRITSWAALFLAGWVLILPAWLAMVLLQESPMLLLILLLVVWIADSAAYFAGRRFGRRKLAPHISPGKTWEGVVGAVVALLVYGLAISFALHPQASLYDRAGLLTFIMVLLVFSIIGDLFESWIKRQAGAKDSGELLPGHGGVLDRIDSLTAALPFAALYFLHSS